MNNIICNKDKCSGCLACVVACIDHHYTCDQEEAISGRIHEKEKSPKSDLISYKTRSCHHCENAPCIKNCPSGALAYNEYKLVVFDQDKCIGCKACAKSCPYDIARYNKDGKIVKCDGCSHRLEIGKNPACVRTCPSFALARNTNNPLKI